MNASLQELVRARAGNRCEYCRLPASVLPLTTFHIEHIVARQHGGLDSAENLALACDRCNAFKGPNLSAIDPATGRIISVFHPRTEQWAEHFKYHDFQIIGLTDVGRATVRLLNMNVPRRVELRRTLQLDLR